MSGRSHLEHGHSVAVTLAPLFQGEKYIKGLPVQGQTVELE